MSLRYSDLASSRSLSEVLERTHRDLTLLSSDDSTHALTIPNARLLLSLR